MKIRIFSRTLRQADAILPKPQVQQLPAKACVEQHPCTAQAVHQTHFSTQCGESIAKSGLVQRCGGRPPLCSIHVDHGKLASSRHQKMCSRMHWLVKKKGCSAKAPVDSAARASAKAPARSWKYREGPCLFWRRASEGPAASEVLASPAALGEPK